MVCLVIIMRFINYEYNNCFVESGESRCSKTNVPPLCSLCGYWAVCIEQVCKKNKQLPVCITCRGQCNIPKKFRHIKQYCTVDWFPAYITMFDDNYVIWISIYDNEWCIFWCIYIMCKNTMLVKVFCLLNCFHSLNNSYVVL